MPRFAAIPYELTWPYAVRSIRVIRRPKLMGIGQHVGVLLETAWGSVIYDRTSGTGLRRLSVDGFAESRRCSTGEPISDRDALNASLARLRAAWVTPSERTYDPLGRNCEHFVSFVLTGKRQSPQSAGALTIGAFALVAALTRT